ncbi:hypothetical protein SEUCBS140593_004513 [Sporothrix eucalyptigena]|uniref:Uncharacterized protein n=1 Tax=Sporothrix eucalyptigena TaxID=1812306 RepID=A0ABP0BP87_9PEZI
MSATVSSSSPAASSSSPAPSSSSLAPYSSLSSSSTVPSSASSSSSSSAPSSTCSGLTNGNFVNGVLAPWYISDQMTADSHVVSGGPSISGYMLNFVPSQTHYAQVYLDQLLPSCGNPPPEVTVHISFKYMFTGSSSGCKFGARINQDGANLLDVEDTGKIVGEWYTYTGPATTVQLSYNPLFTLMMSCQTNTAQTSALYVTDISVY